MAFDDKVVWSEGLFIRAHHFQQDARYFERLVRDRTSHLRPHGWGLFDCKIDAGLLAIGRFALEHASGVFEDGTPFRIPDGASPIEPVRIPEDTSGTFVFVELPVMQLGGREIAPLDSAAMTRLAATEIEVPDATSSDPETATLTVGKLRIRYGLRNVETGGTVAIPVARIAEVRSDGSVLLDDGFIPPVMTTSASVVLASALTETVGLLNHRGQAIAARLRGVGAAASTAAEITDAMMLLCINRAQAQLAHLARDGLAHPHDVFASLVGLAAELSTFTEEGRRPKKLPVYEHKDLQATFMPLIRLIREALSAVLDPGAVLVPLTEHRYGIRLAEITDKAIFERYAFVLAARADMPTDVLMRRLVGQAKIGAADTIGELVNAALPGIMLRSLPVAPRQIPHESTRAYFELDRTSPLWRQVAPGGGLAIHIAGEFPGLDLALWALKTD